MQLAMRASLAVCILFACAGVSFAFGKVFAQGVPKPILVTPLKLTDLPGRWVGVGNMRFRDGTTEQMECRITYRFHAKGRLIQNIWCKNANMRLEIKTRINDDNGKITGSWNDRVYAMSGDLAGRLHGNQIQAALSSTFFNATLNVMMIGSTQTIQVTPNDGHLRSMRISLARN
jgi:hypothetical protein